MQGIVSWVDCVKRLAVLATVTLSIGGCSGLDESALDEADWPSESSAPIVDQIREPATVVDSGFTDAAFASGFSNPTAMAFAPDGRLFVCQQTGQLRVIKNGALLATPFLTVT